VSTNSHFDSAPSVLHGQFFVVIICLLFCKVHVRMMYSHFHHRTREYTGYSKYFQVYPDKIIKYLTKFI
jgi:hypothetical protein